MNFYLNFKRMQKAPSCRYTESTKDHSPLYKLCSTASSKRFTSTPKDQQPEKNNTTDFKAFKTQYRMSQQDHFTCFSLINIPYPTSFVTNNDLLKLDFFPLAYPIKDLIIYAKSIIQSNLDRKIIGKSFNLHKLIQIIADNYRVSAYHNFTHAFSVLLLLYQSYSRSEHLQRCISQKQWFYVFIAALMHDLNHPGSTNSFQVKQRSELAIEANNQSVLEKMHLSSFWKLIRGNSQVNFLQGYSASESNQIRRLITRMVMSTDSAKHVHAVEGLKHIHKNRRPLKGENAIFLVQQLFHACDIGNSCLPFESYLTWSVLVSYEFDLIARKEQQLSLEVTSCLKYEGLDKFYKGQLDFTTIMVLPLWKEIHYILPELEEIMYNLADNIEELKHRVSVRLS